MGIPSRKDTIIDMLQKEPEDLFLNYALAMEHLSTNELLGAEQQFEKVLAINPQYLPCFYQLGQLKEKQGEPEEAIAFYTKGIELAHIQHNTKALGELKEALWMLED